MKRVALILLLLATGVAFTTPQPTREIDVKKLSPLISVEEIEPCLPFWTDRLGFEVTVTVPQEDKMGFAILQKGGVEIMYQSRAGIAADLPALADELVGQTTL